ncbi:MAG: tRNA-dihydrouridine synthase family protein [Nanoarchaeota archaeon]|nr:tRNA-dihydrouridine synthase family protein [Nanoarchaeota archaeon]
MILMLAPIEAMTDSAFRKLCFMLGCDLTMTEMVRINALASGEEHALAKTKLIDDTPTQVQIVGSSEEALSVFLKEYIPGPGFSGININLGCPNPMIIQLGAGAALVKRTSKVKRMVEMIKARGFPVSVKMRLGANQLEKDSKVYLRLINEVDADFFVVHARHGKQTYQEPADFSVYPECIKTGKKIVANGDIKTKAQVDSLEKMGAYGVMIGRAAIENPGIFSSLKGKSTGIDIRETYMELSANSVPKYRNNVLRRMTQF